MTRRRTVTETAASDEPPEIRRAGIGVDLYRGSGLLAGVEHDRDECRAFGLTDDEVAFLFDGRP